MNTKEALIEEYRDIIRICELYHLDEHLEQLNVKLRDLEEPLKFMIVGEGKSGKSTLLNALVGKEIAEVDDEPKTWCINAYYNTNEEPYAELIYADEVIRVDLEEANRISKRIGTSRGKNGGKLCEKDAMLKEIRWHMKLEWPEEDIVLIDTPGFNQIDGHAHCKMISIDGLEGIQYEAIDGFEGIQYKADLLLWCLDADNVGDEEVEKKLKNVPIDTSRIYGIVTKLDRKEPKDRERLFARNEKQYKNYVKQFLKSSLPTVYSDDSLREAEEKRRMRTETVEGIRWCIEYLLKSNDSLEIIKAESSAQYLQGVKRKISLILKCYTGFYYENGRLYNRVTKEFLADINKESELAMEDITYKVSQTVKNVVDRSYLQQLWNESGEDAEQYAELLKKCLSETGVMEYCNAAMEKYRKAGMEISSHYVDDVRWKKLLVFQKSKDAVTLEDDSLKSAEIMPAPVIETMKLELGSMGIAYGLSQFLNEFGLEAVTKALFGQYLQNKAVKLGEKAVTECISECGKQSQSYIERYTRELCTAFEEYISNSFVRQTGVRPEDVEDTIITLERVLTEQQWYDENIPYYPVWDKDKVVFIQSRFLPELSGYGANVQTVETWIEDKVIVPAINEKERMIEEEFRSALKCYDGTKVVEMPSDRMKSRSFLKEEGISKYIPCIGRAVWGESEGVLERYYQSCMVSLQERCENLWKRICKEETEKFVKKKGDQQFQEFQREYRSFIKAWEGDLRSRVQEHIGRNELFQIPQECEYAYFYQYYYYPTHVTETAIRFLYEYELKKSVPNMLMRKMCYVAPDGTVLDVLFEVYFQQLFEMLLSKIKQKRTQCLQNWDDAVHLVYAELCQRYEQVYLQLDQMMETSVQPLWDGYKKNMEGKESRRIWTVLDFVKKRKLLPEVYVRLLEGNVRQEDLGMAGYCVYSDGQSVYNKVAVWVKERAEEAQKRWR